MGIAVYTQDRSFRNFCLSHSEDGIAAFSTKGSGKARLRQVLCSIKRHRHSSGSGLDGAIFSNREVADWAFNSDAKFAARSADLGEAIRFRSHSSEHGSFAREYAVRGIAKRFLHQLNTSKRKLVHCAHTNSCANAEGSQRAAAQTFLGGVTQSSRLSGRLAARTLQLRRPRPQDHSPDANELHPVFQTPPNRRPPARNRQPSRNPRPRPTRSQTSPTFFTPPTLITPTTYRPPHFLARRPPPARGIQCGFGRASRERSAPRKANSGHNVPCALG